jgi:predicted secreted protein
MPKNYQLQTITIAMCLLLAACSAAVTGPESKIVLVTPAIEGNSASLSVGDSLEIQIPTIPTVGFEWQAQNLDTKILKQEGSAVYNADNNPNAAGGIVTVKFLAVGAGITNLNLLYVSSQTSTLPSVSSNSFGMTVEVK